MIYLTQNCSAPTAVRFCQTTWYNDYYFWSIIVYNYEIISLIVCTKSIHIQQDYLSCSIRDSHTDKSSTYKSESQIDTTNHTPHTPTVLSYATTRTTPTTAFNYYFLRYYIHPTNVHHHPSILRSTLAAIFLFVPTLLHPTYLVHTFSTVHQQYSIFFKFSTYVGIIFLPISIPGSTHQSTYVRYRTLQYSAILWAPAFSFPPWFESYQQILRFP